MRERKPATRLDIQLLGTFYLVFEGQVVTGLDSPRIQELLAYLLLHQDAPQSRQQIAFVFWPDSSDAQARTNLRQLLYRLRQELPEADQFLLSEGSTLQWRAQAPFQLDVDGFQEALARAEEAVALGDQELATTAWTQAVDTYRGELLPDCYEEWILPQRERLRQQYAGALEQLTSMLADKQNVKQAIHYARLLLAQDELLETNVRRLMRLYAMAGNRAAGLRVYHNSVTILERELGVAPGVETRRLYEQLMAAPARKGILEADRPFSAVPTPVQNGLAAHTALVGRKQEWGGLQAAWQATAARPHVVLLVGEAGIGKTRLAEQFLQWAGRQGIVTAAARCYPGEGGLAFAPVAAWLRTEGLKPALARVEDTWLVEIARILPEVAVARHDAPTAEPEMENWQQQRFFDGLVRAFVAVGKPLVLFLDDVHWADQATLAWLGYFLASQSLKQVLLLGTVRKEELAEDHPLNPFRWRLAAEAQLNEIDLGPLSREETVELAGKVVGHALDAALAERFYRETEGNPLFVTESARMVQASGELDSKDAFLPPRVQAVIEARLSQLSPGAREVAAFASALSTKFSFELLSQAGDYSEEELVSSLDELWRRRLVREVDEADYDLSHGKIRDVAYAALSRPRRQHVHRRLAEALEIVHTADLDQVSGRIASHYVQAGEPHKAFDFYVHAAEHAASLYAYGEAQALYSQAISLAARPRVHDPQLGQLYARRGRMLEHAGRFEEAASLYQELKDLAQRRGDRALTGLALARLVSCYIEPNAIHDLQAAEPLIEQGLVVAREIGDPALEADLLWSQMIRETHYGHTEEAQRIGEHCLSIAREHGLERRMGYVLHDLALNLRLAGKVKRGTGYAEEAQTIFRKLGNYPLLADSLNQKGLMHILHLDFAKALDYLVEAQQVSERINNRWNLAYSSWLQGMIWYAQGAWDRAQEAWQESVQQGERVGFLTGVTAVRLQQGMLLRQLGDLQGASKRHEKAYEASLEHAPFLLPFAESELARDALAAGDLQAGQEWLAKARARQVLGDIGTGLFLSSPALAQTELAAFNHDWPPALQGVEKALREARQRGLFWHEAGLLLAHGCCMLALGAMTEAGQLFMQAIALTQQAGLRPLQMQAQMALAQLFSQEGQNEDAAPALRASTELMHNLSENLPNAVQRQRFLDTPAVRAMRQPDRSRPEWPFPLFN